MRFDDPSHFVHVTETYYIWAAYVYTFQAKKFFQSAVYEISVSLLLVREIKPVRVEFYNNSYIK